jgi:hypothetical protein
MRSNLRRDCERIRGMVIGEVPAFDDVIEAINAA